MKKIIYFLLSIGVGILTTTCEPDAADDPCGEAKTVVLTWGPNFTKFLEDTCFFNYIQGNNRVFQVSSEVFHNVCPLEHIKAKFVSYINRPDSSQTERFFTMRLKYIYGPFGLYGNDIPSDKIEDFQTNYHVSGGNEFGIKNAYDTDPGAFFVELEWLMENYQDEQVDKDYFIHYIDYAAIQIDYKEYKEPD